ncbi:metalloregulator ArsR/SmtB family transcription factor [Aquisalimonas sp. 2447]|uniref:ArsR/SmtB family transcription factor n=1 Tax=Aquisalimonas sp. 2447 TaxID=2740807 RepID=UPI0014326E63|nr:metalloregulator ArsR/SmtB family transcription factor [Aquisalimonas sp. 2447]QIT55257.1 metalloregulator ArsR/SmtB family transcription factor [Aquisalimonas sp. 2447]
MSSERPASDPPNEACQSGYRQEVFDTLSQVGRALGNGNRLELLERLAQTEASVEVLAHGTGLSVANASQHLQHLRRAGLVTTRREGRQVVYRLTDTRIITLMTLMREIAETNLAEMERLVGKLFAGDDAGGALEPMSRHALRAALDSGEVTLLDVRPEEEYQAGHLPNAINVPIEKLEQMLERLPPDQEIVAYCRGPYCVLSHEAVQLLRRKGFRVRRYEEGYPEWKAAGLPVD